MHYETCRKIFYSKKLEQCLVKVKVRMIYSQRRTLGLCTNLSLTVPNACSMHDNTIPEVSLDNI